MKKRGFFFEVDAAIALFVLIVGAFIIASFYLNTTKVNQVEFLSDDLMNMLANTKIKDLDNPYAGLGGDLWKAGEITDPDSTLLQQVGQLYSQGKYITAEKFISNVSIIVVPPQYNYEVWMNNQSIYPITLDSAHNSSRNSSTLLIATRRISYGVLNKSTGDMWGPYKVEVYVWQR